MHLIKKIISVTILLTGFLFSKSLIVDQSGNGDYLNINDAVSAATTGDTIKVKSGIYTEGIVLVDKNLVIIGDGAETTSIINSSYAISLSTLNGNASGGENIEIIGFHIKSSSNYAVYLESSSGSKRIFNIKKCIVESESTSSEGGAIRAGAGSKESPLDLNIYNSVIKNSNYGITVWGDGGKVNIINSLFIENATGIKIGHSGNRAGDAIIQNSIFYNNTTGIYKYDNSNATALSIYNSFYSNSTNSYLVTNGTGTITDDPKFNDLSKGYSTSATSPLIDAGNPSSIYNDFDGSRNDIGVYGGPYTWSVGPAITSLSISSNSVQQGATITITGTAKSK